MGKATAREICVILLRLMASISLDTLKTVQKLQTKGFTAEQAEGIVETLTESELVTKSDLKLGLSAQSAELKVWVAGMLVAQAALVVALQNLIG